MKPREKTEPATHSGFNIRMPLADIDVFDGLAAVSQSPTVNQFMSAKVVTVLDICESLTVSHELRKENIPQIIRLLWRQLEEKDVRRSVPGTLSKPVKLTLPHADRQRIETASRQLRWSASQVVVEAIQAYAQLAAGEGILYELPDIIRLYRGNRIFLAEAEPETAEVVLGKLNLALGRITRLNLDSTPTQPQSMTTDIEIDLT